MILSDIFEYYEKYEIYSGKRKNNAGLIKANNFIKYCSYQFLINNFSNYLDLLSFNFALYTYVHRMKALTIVINKI